MYNYIYIIRKNARRITYIIIHISIYNIDIGIFTVLVSSRKRGDNFLPWNFICVRVRDKSDSKNHDVYLYVIIVYLFQAFVNFSFSLTLSFSQVLGELDRASRSEERHM